MKYEVILSEQADTDLRCIYEYIACTLLESQIAEKQLERIEYSILGLDEMPERFRMFDQEPWRSRGLRQIPVDILKLETRTDVST
jgi:toxin ParE1/3/4